MAQYTPNFNLYEPDSSDDFADFRTEFNNNMNIIDQNLGGGGGSGGHTIVDGDGNALPQEDDLQFTGACNVTDDNVNGRTVVDIKGGNIYGAFLDPSRVIYSAFTFDNTEHSWTATEDVILTDDILPPSGTMAWYVRIDSKQVGAGYDLGNLFVYVKKGQVVTYRAKSGSSMKAYGIIQGTNGIFAPVIYSDTERKIGVWRDNKPLYQKTIYTNNATVNNAVTISVSSLNIDSLVDIKGTYDRIENWISPPLHIVYCFNGFESNNEQSFVRYDKDDNNILYRITVDSNEATSYQAITIRYTKTTDLAGSGNWNTDGVPTVHYSTSEQVIGTWIDNKPLYRRVLELTQDTNLIADTWVKTEFNQDTKKALIKAVAVIGSSGAVIEALSGGFIDGKIALNSARNVGLNVADNARLIVEYTKTTD